MLASCHAHLRRERGYGSGLAKAFEWTESMCIGAMLRFTLYPKHRFDGSNLDDMEVCRRRFCLSPVEAKEERKMSSRILLRLIF